MVVSKIKNKGIENEEIEESVSYLKGRKKQIEQRIIGCNFKWWGLILASIFGGTLSYAIYSLRPIYLFYNTSTQKQLPIAILGSLGGSFIYAYFVVGMSSALRSELRRIELKLVISDTEELQENIEDDIFTKLIKINFKYIDQYYLQTQEQAEKSFKLASYASISGLIIIIIGIIMMFLNKMQPAYVTTDAGIISEFIAAVFFYLYNLNNKYHAEVAILKSW